MRMGSSEFEGGEVQTMLWEVGVQSLEVVAHWGPDR